VVRGLNEAGSGPRLQTQIQCRIWGSHSGSYEEYYLVGYNAVQSIESQLTFRRNMWPLSSRCKNKPSKKPAFTLVSCSAHFSTLKVEAICSSETSVDFQWTERRYIPQDSTLQLQCKFCANIINVDNSVLNVGLM
jgi:hypothetical protein